MRTRCRKIWSMWIAVILLLTTIAGSLVAATSVKAAEYGSGTINLAQGKNGYASSNQRGDSTVGERQVSFLTDGSVDNFIILHQNDSDPYVYVDLGSSYSVNKVEVYQGANSDYPLSYAKKFTVEYTENISNGWKTAVTVTGANTGKNIVIFTPVTARYIRIHVQEQYGTNASFRELKVYETDYNAAPEVVAKPMRILFIGNSLTHYNDVAIKVRDLFAAVGQEVDVDTLIQLGKSLNYHATLAETRPTIVDGNYDYVILQDKASNFDGDGLMTGVQTIYEWISQTNAKTMLYMPWANESVLQDTQSYFTSSYVAAARAIGAQLAPAGEAWYELYYHYGYNWYADNTHANNTGSLVSAATIFYALTGRTTPLVFAASDSIITKNEVDVNVMNLIQERCCLYAAAYQDLDHILTVEPGAPIETVQKTELAQGKAAYASSNQRGDGTVGLRQVSFLTDGKDTTFIILHQDDPDPYVYVDLGDTYAVDQVVVNQGANSTYPDSYATRFAVEYTTDLNETWKTAATVTDGVLGENDVTFTAVNARYIRIHVLEQYSTNASFLELNVYESKDPVVEQIDLYFDKPDAWGTSINAYLYGESGGDSQNAPWPGMVMTLTEDGLYKITVDDTYAGAYIIFNDGTNQAPASMEPGYIVVEDGVYTSAGYTGKQVDAYEKETVSSEEETSPEESGAASTEEMPEESDAVTEPSQVTAASAVYQNGAVQLTWADNGAVMYKVVRSDGRSGYVNLTYSATAAGWTDTKDLIEGQLYYYRVIGYFRDAEGNLVMGEQSDATAVVILNGAPARVENVTAIVNGKAVTLNWDAASNVRYYKVSRAEGATGAYYTLKYNILDTTYTDTVSAAGTYRYKVVGYYKDVDGSWAYGELCDTLYVRLTA